jgi:hypothetical protein
MTYLHNIRQWLTGFVRFGEISFKPGWSGKSPAWWLLYAFNYGTRVLTGGACVSWSKWFYLNRNEDRLANLVTKLLDKIDWQHGYRAGPILWNTTDTSWARSGAYIFWTSIVGVGVWILV